MRHALDHAAMAALLCAGLAGSAWGQMQVPSTAPNGARMPATGTTALPPGPPGVRAKPGDPLPPPSDLTPNATPRYAGATTDSQSPTPGAPPATTQQDASRTRTPARAANDAQRDMHRGASDARHDMDHGMRHDRRAARDDASTFARGLRECADKVDREDRARCASDLYASPK